MQFVYGQQARAAEPPSPSQVAGNPGAALDSFTTSRIGPRIGSSTACWRASIGVPAMPPPPTYDEFFAQRQALVARYERLGDELRAAQEAAASARQAPNQEENSPRPEVEPQAKQVADLEHRVDALRQERTELISQISEIEFSAVKEDPNWGQALAEGDPPANMERLDIAEQAEFAFEANDVLEGTVDKIEALLEGTQQAALPNPSQDPVLGGLASQLFGQVIQAAVLGPVALQEAVRHTATQLVDGVKETGEKLVDFWKDERGALSLSGELPPSRHTDQQAPRSETPSVEAKESISAATDRQVEKDRAPEDRSAVSLAQETQQEAQLADSHQEIPALKEDPANREGVASPEKPDPELENRLKKIDENFAEKRYQLEAKLDELKERFEQKHANDVPELKEQNQQKLDKSFDELRDALDQKHEAAREQARQEQLEREDQQRRREEAARDDR